LLLRHALTVYQNIWRVASWCLRYTLTVDEDVARLAGLLIGADSINEDVALLADAAVTVESRVLRASLTTSTD
jgi:hypothetical protein